MNSDLQSIKFYLIHVIVAVITVACFLMNGPMREGLPLDTSLSDRMAFISANGFIWTVSWVVWMFSAIGLFVFCSILADEIRSSVFSKVGVALVAMGIAPDLIAEVIYAFVIPEVIDRNIGSEFVELLEVIAAHLTGYLGNGLYNLGGLLLTILAFQQGVLKTWIAIWGGVAWGLGLMLSFSIAAGSFRLAEIFTATSMTLSTAWMLIFAYKVLRS